MEERKRFQFARLFEGVDEDKDIVHSYTNHHKHGDNVQHIQSLDTCMKSINVHALRVAG